VRRFKPSWKTRRVHSQERKMSTLRGGLVSLLMLLVPQWVQAEAPELRVEQSIEINAPADEVWEVAGDFVGISRWLPTIASGRMILGKNRESGSIRELTRMNGTKVEEKLLEYDSAQRTFTYTYVGGQPAASHYFATMKVDDVGGGKSRVKWKASFKRLDYWTDQPPPGQEDETLLKAFNRVYTLGLETLKKVVEEK
jgi:mxaD protein